MARSSGETRRAAVAKPYLISSRCSDEGVVHCNPVRDTLSPVTPEQTPTRKVERTPEGLEVELRAPMSAVVARIISQLVQVAVGWYGLKASRTALSDWTTTREIHGLLGFLDEQDFSEKTIQRLLYAAIGVSAYLIVAGTIDVLIRLTRRDRITFR